MCEKDVPRACCHARRGKQQTGISDVAQQQRGKSAQQMMSYRRYARPPAPRLPSAARHAFSTPAIERSSAIPCCGEEQYDARKRNDIRDPRPSPSPAPHMPAPCRAPMIRVRQRPSAVAAAGRCASVRQSRKVLLGFPGQERLYGASMSHALLSCLLLHAMLRATSSFPPPCLRHHARCSSRLAKKERVRSSSSLSACKSSPPHMISSSLLSTLFSQRSILFLCYC